MKKFLLLFAVAITFIGCSLDDDNPKFHLELLPVESATLPDEFKRDSVYELPIKYIRPSTCHIFEGFYYEKNENVRTVAIQTSVVEQDNCVSASTEPITEILKFKPTTGESYIFKFWKGEDESGEDIFEEIEVPVVQ
jgi:hypothetical protein